MRLLLVCCLLFSWASAQESYGDELSLVIKPKSGFLAAHRGTMSHLGKERIAGLEVSLYKRLKGSTNWSDAYKQPYIGITLYGSSLGNQQILGDGFGSYGFIEFPMNRSKKNILTAKLSAGLGYVTKVFDQQSNPKNVAVSSHVNALLCLGLQGRWQITPTHALVYSMDMTHFSNGSTKVPNLGLNMPFLGLGYAYTFKRDAARHVPPLVVEKTPFFSHWKLTAVGILSFKEIFPTSGPKYPIYAINSFVSKRFRPKVGMEVGLDFISKQSLFNYRPYIPKTQLSIFQIGAYSAYVLPFEKLRIILGMGIYVKDRYDADNEFYHRVGMRYQLDNGVLLNLVLKSHWAKADYVEWGVGYTFKYKKK